MARREAAGVGRHADHLGTRLDQFDKMRAIAERHEEVWCSVGVHPHEAEEEQAALRPKSWSNSRAHPKVIGIGETGLDYYYDHSPRDEQEASFRAHIAACRETGLPLIVHTRDADAETGDILEEECGQGALARRPDPLLQLGPGTGGAGAGARLVHLDLGHRDLQGGRELRDIVRDIPLDRLLVETDAPYLAPVPKRGKTNEPAFVAHTAAKVAELKGIPVEELAARTTENFLRLFNRMPAPVS